MDIMAQAIAGLAREGHGGNGGNGGGARRPGGPSSYQDFLKTHPPTFTPSVTFGLVWNLAHSGPYAS